MIAELGQHMTSEHALKDITLLLTGDDFCGSLTVPEAIAPCQDWTQQFVPVAMPVIAEYLADYAEGACAEAFEVC